MIIDEFNIPHLNLTYSVGISQIMVDLGRLVHENRVKDEKSVLDCIFNTIEQIQDSFPDCSIQFFSNKYILDCDHIFNACYFMELAFLNNLNISNKKNIELLLYLATSRQIKIGIDSFGINYSDLEKGELTYCIVSHKNNIPEINEQVLQHLFAEEIELSLNQKSFAKYDKVKKFFEITDNQIEVVLKSYGIKKNLKNLNINDLADLYLAINDLICEKMTLLSLEKTTIDS